MIEAIRKLLGLCAHHWEDVEWLGVFNCFSNKQIGIRVIQRCTHCGDLQCKEF